MCRAGDLGLGLASVHAVDVSLSKVLHHYLLQGQSLLGYGACDVARSCSGYFLGSCTAAIVAPGVTKMSAELPQKQFDQNHHGLQF